MHNPGHSLKHDTAINACKKHLSHVPTMVGYSLDAFSVESSCSTVLGLQNQCNEEYVGNTKEY